MTAPICHGAAGGCFVAGEASIHTLKCPMRYAPPTKRAMGRCECGGFVASGVRMPGHHAPDCPALYPLQPQPGSARDALTRLTAHVRSVPHVAMERECDAFRETAIDLISEAREEQRLKVGRATAEVIAFAESVRDTAAQDFSAISLALARSEPLPECRSAGGIVIVKELEMRAGVAASVAAGVDDERVTRIRADLDASRMEMITLRSELSKVKADLLTTQRTMGEARQQAFRDMAAEMIDMTPNERYRHLTRILDGKASE